MIHYYYFGPWNGKYELKRKRQMRPGDHEDMYWLQGPGEQNMKLLLEPEAQPLPKSGSWDKKRKLRRAQYIVK
jgi:hypothetical protein